MSRAAILWSLTFLVTLTCVTSVRANLAPTSGEFLVNTYTTNAQYDADVAPLSADNFVVVWTSYFQDGSYSGVFGQRVDTVGARLGTEFRVSVSTVGYQQSAAVAGTPSGNFVVVWEDDYAAINCPNRIMGRLYDANGTPITGQFQVNASSFPCGVSDADVAAIADDDFMVVWQSLQAGVDQTEIRAQRISETGAKVGTEFQVNTYTTEHQDDPEISSRSDGSFVVVWGGRSSSTNADVRGQRFDANAAPLGSEFLINSYTEGQQREPDVAASESGEFVAAWRSIGQDGSYSGVYGQRFDASGVAAGTEFRVNVHTQDSQGNAGIDIAYAPTGEFVVTWNSFYQDGSYSGVLLRAFDGGGAPLGDEFFANHYTTNSQRRCSIAADVDGDFVVVWDSFYQDDHYHAVIGRRFTLGEGTTTTTVPPTTTTTTSTTTTTTTTTTSSLPPTTLPTTTTSSSTTTTLPSGACGDPAAPFVVGAVDPTGGIITASDALFVLNAAIGAAVCELCICDVNDSDAITATDALAVLNAAIGLPIDLVCPPCM